MYDKNSVSWLFWVKNFSDIYNEQIKCNIFALLRFACPYSVVPHTEIRFNLPSCPLWLKLGGLWNSHTRTIISSLALIFNLILQTGNTHKQIQIFLMDFLIIFRFCWHLLRIAHWKLEWHSPPYTPVFQEQNPRPSQMQAVIWDWCVGRAVKTLQNPPIAAYPALCLSFLSRIPSLETSLLNTKMPITMLTCQTETKVEGNQVPDFSREPTFIHSQPWQNYVLTMVVTGSPSQIFHKCIQENRAIYQ